MNILITGGSGFIGSNLVDELLKRGNLIINIDNHDTYYSPKIKYRNISNALKWKTYKFIKSDIRDTEILENIFSNYNIDIVIHLAAKAGVRPSIINPKEYYDVNVNGTLNILEAMRKFNVRKLIFASSSSVYGNNNKIPFKENDSVDYPISPYAASKKAGELLGFTYHHLYNFDISCLRFFTVYGPRQRPDLAIHKFTKLITENNIIPCYGNGTSERDYTYIDDIVDGITKAITNINGYNIYNLGESKTISLSNMISVLGRTLGKNINIEKLPKQQGDVEKTFADITKAKKELGYNPKVDLEMGIELFVKWFENNCKN